MKPAGLGTFFVKLTINGKNEAREELCIKSLMHDVVTSLFTVPEAVME